MSKNKKRKPTKHSKIIRDLRTPKYKMRVKPSKKTTYKRKRGKLKDEQN